MEFCLKVNILLWRKFKDVVLKLLTQLIKKKHFSSWLHVVQQNDMTLNQFWRQNACLHIPPGELELNQLQDEINRTEEASMAPLWVVPKTRKQAACTQGRRLVLAYAALCSRLTKQVRIQVEMKVTAPSPGLIKRTWLLMNYTADTHLNDASCFLHNH